MNMKCKKRRRKSKKINFFKTDIGWGHQIRSYVLQPYQLVKDLRNKIENTNPSSVLMVISINLLRKVSKKEMKKKVILIFCYSFFLRFYYLISISFINCWYIETKKFNNLFQTELIKKIIKIK